MLTENRLLTPEELKELHPILEKLHIEDTENILRFVDTKLEKTYDVYLIKMENETRILKQVGPSCADKVKYDMYFAEKDFAVPKVFESVSVDSKDYVLMQFVEGVDARNCSPADAAKVGSELGRIQSFYLTDGGHTESAERYWNPFLEEHYEKLKRIFPDIDDVWELTKQRFFEAPQTLVHEDFLPINVLVGRDKICIIDWEMSGVYPYFIDLARFAYVFSDTANQFFISTESAKAFIDAYYDEMKKNSFFDIDRKQFMYDVTVSAFYQYIAFQEYEKELKEIEDTQDFKFLKEIIEVLRG